MNMNLFVLALVALVSAPAFAADKKSSSAPAYMDRPAMTGEADRIDGCGLGWQVTAKRTMLATTTRGTTNAFVPPSFGMTSGTIGCDRLDFAKNEQKAVIFVSENVDHLKLEMAVGQGEYVETLAAEMGCHGSAVRSFAEAARANYDTVTAFGRATGVEIYKNLRTIAASCAAGV